MSEMIISCAGCGKRYKGVPGHKKFKCSGCHNVFTFPEAPREPGAGKILCSQCWTEMDWRENLSACTNCSQRIVPSHGARAMLWAAGSSLAPSVARETTKILGEHHELIARIGELTAQLAQAHAMQAQLQSELATAHADADAQVASLRQEVDAANQNAHAHGLASEKTRAELEQYRAMAFDALEPLSLEYTRRMREMIAETDKLRTGLRQAREDMGHRIEKVESCASELREKLNATCREVNEKLSDVLGVDANHGEVLTSASQLPAGPLAELLAAGVLTSDVGIVVTRHPKPEQVPSAVQH